MQLFPCSAFLFEERQSWCFVSRLLREDIYICEIDSAYVAYSSRWSILSTVFDSLTDLHNLASSPIASNLLFSVRSSLPLRRRCVIEYLFTVGASSPVYKVLFRRQPASHLESDAHKLRWNAPPLPHAHARDADPIRCCLTRRDVVPDSLHARFCVVCTCVCGFWCFVVSCRCVRGGVFVLLSSLPVLFSFLHAQRSGGFYPLGFPHHRRE